MHREISGLRAKTKTRVLGGPAVCQVLAQPAAQVHRLQIPESLL